jgi:hypothetical protein
MLTIVSQILKFFWNKFAQLDALVINAMIYSKFFNYCLLLKNEIKSILERN